MLHCPNCNSPVDSEPVRCGVCGYRSDLAREFFWLYLGGATIVLLGLAIGAFSLALEGAGPEHWSLALRGWFPLAPWPGSHHWLAFLVVGIVLTVSGLGITRRRVFAWVGLTALALYQFLWVLLAGAGLVGPGDVTGLCAALGGADVILLALLARVGLAIRRTPERDAHQLQLRAREKRSSETGEAAHAGGKTSNDK